MDKTLPACARCPFDMQDRLCQKQEGKAPPFCPTAHREAVIEKARKELEKPEIREFSRQASIQEAECYADREQGYEAVRPQKPRIVEIVEFAHRMGYQRIGLVFCMGLRTEGKAVEGLLAANGFTVISGTCKMGRVSKAELGLRQDQQVRTCRFEAMCNPIAQAMLFNEEQTEFNVMLGLCVGHDSLFLKYAEAPTTIFAVKDRLLGHNPLAAIYTLDTFYRWLKIPRSQE
ncbi:MAG: DUF1847 domain-containing protein [Deltaproteobacteria bacterium]|nr:DUF1847 domain-containing protein [Deltaproteobacteria bacterium]